MAVQVRALSKEWADRAALPGHVVTMLNNFPSNLHPMSQFTAAIAALNSESKFAKAYAEGIHKSKYWEVKNIQIFFLTWLSFVIICDLSLTSFLR